MPKTRDSIREKTQMPSEEEFKQSLDEAKKLASSVGLTREDADAAVKTVRSGENKCLN